MNINEIPLELIKLHTAQNEKMGKQCPAPTLMINARDDNAFWLSLDCSPAFDTFIRHDTPDEVFAKAWAALNSLPSLAEQQLAEFQRGLGKLIDMGRDYNIPLDLVNPLIATSKKLAENAITKQDVE